MANNRIKILVIDDIQDNVIILNAMIKDAFPEAIILNALNGKTGLELAAKEDPDVILLDIIMPGMDGYEVCQKLKADKKLCDIPVVFVTAIKDTKENRIQALECGGEAFLTKPIDDIELTAQIRAMLKIRNANIQKRYEKEQLIELVEEKTRELNKTYISTLNLLEDLKKEHEARTKSEERFRVVAESAGEWIWEVDNEGMYTYSSSTIEKILGYTPEEIVGNKHFYDFFKEDVKKELKEGAFSVFKQKQVFNDFENPNIHKNGQIVFMNTSGSPILDKEGNLIGYRGADRDITEHKQAKEALFKTTEQLEHIGKMARIGGWELDLATTQVAYSRETARIHEVDFPYVPHKLSQGNEFYPPEVWPDVQATVQAAIEHGTAYDREWPFITAKGNRLWVRAQGFCVKENGKTIKLQGTFQDITERKQAEEKIREKDMQFRKLSSNVSDLLYQFTRRPDGSYCVPIASEGIKNIFGCSPEDVLDDFTPIGRVIYPDDAVRVISDIEYSAEHLTHFTCEFRVQIPGKEIQWIFSRSTPEKLPDGSVTWFGFNADITERKKAELELLLAKEKAEESDRLKTAFLANMSHEIRTPMNGILGFAELLKEPDLTGEQQQEYIRIIEKAGARMLNIITDIVNISKIEAGLMEVNLTESNINEQIEYINTFFKPEVEAKGIQLSFKNALPAKEANVKTDREKVYAILTNLVKNAIKYSKEGEIEFGYLKKGETLEFYVKDTGIGIPKDRQSAIFERFIQADISDKMARQGAGLGLSISKAYVEMLGGKIWVESEEGIGSTFYFNLPYNSEPEEKKVVGKVVPAQNGENQIKDLKILIAEDDETSEMLITIDVEKFSKEILKARNGFEAVEVCRNNPDTDLILMDIQMPVMNGHEATRQIRQFNKDVVIIAQTAFGLSGDREKAIEAGCNDYIKKPINKAELLSLIQKYFKK